MPLRALGYITSALRVQTALPEAQVQMVHTVNTAHRVNGLNPRGPTEQAKQLADLSRLAIERAYGVTHLIDPVSTPMINEEAVASGAGAILLGCTELPLLFNTTQTQVPIYNCLRIYADAIINRYYMDT